MVASSARRSSSACPPVKPATIMAIFNNCSWNSGIDYTSTSRQAGKSAGSHSVHLRL
jgi:hypothetical protein